MIHGLSWIGQLELVRGRLETVRLLVDEIAEGLRGIGKALLGFLTLQLLLDLRDFA